MDDEAVARYLKENPAFFEQHGELLAEVSVPNPHGGAAISLTDRQMLTLRERGRQLEAKLSELLHFGEENDALGEKMHRLSVALVAAPSQDRLLDALQFNLREDLAIPHVALRVWGGNTVEAGARAESAPVSDELKQYAASLSEPFCGPSGQAEAEAIGWLGESASAIRSVGLIALREQGAAGTQGACIGLLMLASEELKRFYPEMGTVYLRRLGELASAGLARFL